MNLPCSSVQAVVVQQGSCLTRQRAEQQLWSELRLQQPALQRSAGNVCWIRDYHTKPHTRDMFIQSCCYSLSLRTVQIDKGRELKLLYTAD